MVEDSNGGNPPVTPGGPISGREAIEKWYADLFKKVQFSYYVITIDQDSPHVTAGNEIWATGGYSSTVKGDNFGPRQIAADNGLLG